jgi:hypothetical protein
MNDFWGNADGDEKKAFVSGFSPIPDGTEALAEINKAFLDEKGAFGPSYQVTWRITEGEYKGRLIFQAIGAFDQDKVRAERAKNMLMYLFNTFKLHVPPHAPKDADLAPMVGRIASIVVGEWINKEGKTKNVIREVHASDKVSHGTIESAFSRNQHVAPVLDNDIPF